MGRDTASHSELQPSSPGRGSNEAPGKGRDRPIPNRPCQLSGRRRPSRATALKEAPGQSQATGSRVPPAEPKGNVQGHRLGARGIRNKWGRCAGRLGSVIQVLSQTVARGPDRETRLPTELLLQTTQPAYQTKVYTAYSSSSSEEDVRDERSDFSLDLSSSSSSSSSE